MYPFYTGYVPDIQLNRDDVLGIQELYGGKFFFIYCFVDVIFFHKNSIMNFYV